MEQNVERHLRGFYFNGVLPWYGTGHDLLQAALMVSFQVVESLT